MTKSTKKRLIIIGIVCLVAWVASFFIGYYVIAPISYDLQEGTLDPSAVLEQMNTVLLYVAPVLFALQLIFILVYSICSYTKAKKIYAVWDGEDEDTVDKAEKLLSKCINALSIDQVVAMLLFAVCVYCTYDKLYSKLIFIVFIVTAVVFIAEVFFITAMQRNVVELIKKMNPEKRGEVLDIKFAKDWEKSMDEAQKAVAFECGFRAYKVGNYTCLGAWLVCVFAIYFGTGLMPLIMVSAIWLAMTITYTVKAYKMEHKKSNNETII